jgi:DHA1 family bicyclomycin/chloramphenicol resistance-like MFS transporter
MNASPSTNGGLGSAERPGRRPPVVALVAVSALSPFAINAIVPSLPAIGQHFGASYGRVQLVLSMFLASVAVAQIFIGPVSDRFGRRPVLLAGFAIFVAASVAAPFAPTIDALIAMRIVQGASGCVGIVLGRAIVRDLFERRQAASMLGYVTMGLAVAPMVAPSVGGLLQEFFGWTAIFWFMVAFGLACLGITWWMIPETNRSPTSRLTVGSLATDFRKLLGSTDFLLFTASSSLSSGVFFSFLGGTPYVAEHLLGLTPSVYGLWFGLIAVGYAAGSFISGRFTEHFGVPRMILIGSTVALVATLIPLVLEPLGFITPAVFFIPMLLVGFANGITLPSAVAGAISARPEIAGAAAGLSGAAQLGTGAILSVAAGAALAGSNSSIPMHVIMAVAATLALMSALAIARRPRR